MNLQSGIKLIKEDGLLRSIALSSTSDACDAIDVDVWPSLRDDAEAADCNTTITQQDASQASNCLVRSRYSLSNVSLLDGEMASVN